MDTSILFKEDQIMAFKTGFAQADDLLREARKNTLNKRINYKGNYENYINGGSHALDNQAKVWDSNDIVKGMVAPGNGWSGERWMEGTNDRYTNPQHNEKAGNAPYGSKLNYIHRYTPSTRRGRRASDIYFNEAKNGKAKTPEELFKVQALVNKYEGR